MLSILRLTKYFARLLRCEMSEASPPWREVVVAAAREIAQVFSAQFKESIEQLGARLEASIASLGDRLASVQEDAADARLAAATAKLVSDIARVHMSELNLDHVADILAKKDLEVAVRFYRLEDLTLPEVEGDCKYPWPDSPRAVAHHKALRKWCQDNIFDLLRILASDVRAPVVVTTADKKPLAIHHSSAVITGIPDGKVMMEGVHRLFCLLEFKLILDAASIMQAMAQAIALAQLDVAEVLTDASTCIVVMTTDLRNDVGARKYRGTVTLHLLQRDGAVMFVPGASEPSKLSKLTDLVKAHAAPESFKHQMALARHVLLDVAKRHGGFPAPEDDGAGGADGKGPTGPPGGAGGSSGPRGGAASGSSGSATGKGSGGPESGTAGRPRPAAGGTGESGERAAFDVLAPEPAAIGLAAAASDVMAAPCDAAVEETSAPAVPASMGQGELAQPSKISELHDGAGTPPRASAGLVSAADRACTTPDDAAAAAGASPAGSGTNGSAEKASSSSAMSVGSEKASSSSAMSLGSSSSEASPKTPGAGSGHTTLPRGPTCATSEGAPTAGTQLASTTLGSVQLELAAPGAAIRNETSISAATAGASVCRAATSPQPAGLQRILPAGATSNAAPAIDSLLAASDDAAPARASLVAASGDAAAARGSIVGASDEHAAAAAGAMTAAPLARQVLDNLNDELVQEPHPMMLVPDHYAEVVQLWGSVPIRK